MTTVTITPVSAWTTPLTTTAVNGQASDAATDVVAPIQVLADRCEYLKDTLLGVQTHSATTFSPVALYNFDGTLNSTVGSNLTLATGAAIYTKQWKLPMIVLDGSTVLKTAAAVPALAVTGAITVMWIQHLAGLGGYRIASYGQEDGDPSAEAENTCWSFEAYSNTDHLAEAKYSYGAGTQSQARFDYNTLWSDRLLGSLCHVALTRASNGTTYKVYINGALAGTAEAGEAPTGGGDASSRLVVGGIYNTGGAYWIGNYGLLGSLAIYNTELSAANVLAQYESCFGNVHGTL